MSTAKTRYEKLWAVLEEFSTAIAGFSDPLVFQWRSAWVSTKLRYEKAVQSGVRKSQIAAGMEQGLRELPEILTAVAGEHRPHVMTALRRAVMANFPEFYKNDNARLSAMMKRSKINNERDYYLARYRIDELEGQADHGDELTLLYRLVDQFDS